MTAVILQFTDKRRETIVTFMCIAQGRDPNDPHARELLAGAEVVTRWSPDDDTLSRMRQQIATHCSKL